MSSVAENSDMKSVFNNLKQFGIADASSFVEGYRQGTQGTSVSTDRCSNKYGLFG